MRGFLRPLISNRAPAYAPLRQSIFGVGVPSSPGIESQMKAYGTVGVLNAVVSRISEAVAEADWALYRVDSDEPLVNHPAAQLWESPNPFMDQDTFIETVMQHFELAGETDWYVSRSTATSLTMPIELWPVRPDRLVPVPSRPNFLDGWSYVIPGEDPVPWRVQDVIQMKRPNPLDPYRGLAPVAAAMIDVYGERAASEYNAMFFRNSAEPGGIIEFPERLSDEAFDEFVDRWGQQHQGVANAHRVAMIEGAKWVERKYTLRDMQFEELRKLNREFIRQAYGYPKSMLGDTEDVNKASAIAGEYVFVRWLVRPRLNRIKAVLDKRLLPMFGAAGSGLEFRFKTPVPADKELEISELDSVATRAKTLVDAGYDPGDVAEYVGLPQMAYSGIPAAAAPPAASTAMLPRAGRPRRTEDDAARAIWDEAVELWETRPGASYEVISGLVGVSERTLRRYRDDFA